MASLHENGQIFRGYPDLGLPNVWTPVEDPNDELREELERALYSMVYIPSETDLRAIRNGKDLDRIFTPSIESKPVPTVSYTDPTRNYRIEVPVLGFTHIGDLSLFADLANGRFIPGRHGPEGELRICSLTRAELEKLPDRIVAAKKYVPPGYFMGEEITAQRTLYLPPDYPSITVPPQITILSLHNGEGDLNHDVCQLHSTNLRPVFAREMEPANITFLLQSGARLVFSFPHQELSS